MVFRLTVWMDILMMGYYSTDEQLGIYRIASALAMIGGIPITALTSIFNPIIARMVAVENFTKLNSLLKQLRDGCNCFLYPFNLLFGLA